MYALLRFTCVLPELHHRLHRLRVGKSHEPEEFGPPTALMEIHLDGFLLLLEHLREKEKKKALGFRKNIIYDHKTHKFNTTTQQQDRDTQTCLW